MNPFTSHIPDSVASKGEAHLIAAIQRWLGAASPTSPAGPGDDCAVLQTRPGRALLVTTDPVVWKRHFDESISPGLVARKLLCRNLSDIAAMGGTPRFAVISWTIPANTKIRWLANFHRALSRDAKRFGVSIVGGDISSTERDLSAHMTMIGEADNRPVLRSGASSGDWIYVTGSLGGSILGKHVRFDPRLAEGQWLARQRGVNCLIDVSDGLAKEVPLITPAQCSAELEESGIPISTAARRLSKQTGKSALEHALTDGEDFELLFAVSPGAGAKRLETAWRRRFTTPLTRIGKFVASSVAAKNGLLEGLKGFEHLSSQQRKRRRS